MSFDLMFQQANTLYLSGSYKEAEKIYRSLLTFLPDNPDVLNMLGLTAAAQNAHREAAEFFYKALKKAPRPLPIYFNLAVSLSAIKKFDEAEEAYFHVLSLAPQTSEAYRNLGLIEKQKGNLSSALDYFQKALQLSPNDVTLLTDIAVLENDENSLLKLVQDFPDNPYPLYKSALLAFDQKDYDNALEKALKADALLKDFDIKNLIAQIYLLKENYEKAADYFHQVLALNAQNLDALIHLGHLENNETYFKKALSIDSQNLSAHMSYADFLYHQKRLAEALEEYHQAVLINSDVPSLSNNMALILRDMGDDKQALDLFLNAFLKDKENKLISINLFETLVMFHKKEPTEALKIAKLWLLNAPGNPFAKRLSAAFENNIPTDDLIYSENLFDSFAPDFDERMQQIGYNIFNKIKELNIELKGKILDLGCGTGLAAENLKTKNSEWTGVDISQKMIEKADEKKLYHALFHDEILSFLLKNEIKYNFILLFDVLEYTKEIEKIFLKCSPIPLLFTTENAPADVQTFALSETGRYQHNEEYIKTILEKSGYQNIKSYPLVLRQEAGKDVSGTLWYAS